MFENPEGIAAAEALTQAIASLDKDVFAAIYDENAVIWHNTTNQTQTPAENAALLAGIFDLASEMYYRDIVRLPTPQGFVQHHTLTGRFKDGAPIPELRACIVATVRNGKIVELREWLDASHFQAVWDRLETAHIG